MSRITIRQCATATSSYFAADSRNRSSSLRLNFVKSKTVSIEHLDARSLALSLAPRLLDAIDVLVSFTRAIYHSYRRNYHLAYLLVIFPLHLPYRFEGYANNRVYPYVSFVTSVYFTRSSFGKSALLLLLLFTRVYTCANY